MRLIIGATALALALFFTTFAGAMQEQSADATVVGNVIEVHGEPVFPVMLLDQCTADSVARAQELGANLIVNEACEGMSPPQQLAAFDGSALAVLAFSGDTTRAAQLAGWTFPDEPENNHWTPETLRSTYPYPRGEPDGRVSLITTGGGFFDEPYRDPNVPLSSYRAFASLADVAGFDLYPLNHCQHDLSAVYESQRRFIALSGNTPTFQWIETGPIRPDYCGGFTMTPAELRAESWLAIIGGARGIGYFTQTWTPEHQTLDLSPELTQTMRELTSTFVAVRPGLLGRTIPSSVNSGGIEVLARTDGTRRYVFAVNHHRTPITAQIYVPGMAEGKVWAVGENRSLHVDESQRFNDVFSPLGVHVYVQNAGGK